MAQMKDGPACLKPDGLFCPYDPVLSKARKALYEGDTASLLATLPRESLQAPPPQHDSHYTSRPSHVLTSRATADRRPSLRAVNAAADKQVSEKLLDGFTVVANRARRNNASSAVSATTPRTIASPVYPLTPGMDVMASLSSASGAVGVGGSMHGGGQVLRNNDSRCSAGSILGHVVKTTSQSSLTVLVGGESPLPAPTLITKVNAAPLPVPSTLPQMVLPSTVPASSNRRNVGSDGYEGCGGCSISLGRLRIAVLPIGGPSATDLLLASAAHEKNSNNNKMMHTPPSHSMRTMPWDGSRKGSRAGMNHHHPTPPSPLGMAEAKNARAATETGGQRTDMGRPVASKRRFSDLIRPRGGGSSATRTPSGRESDHHQGSAPETPPPTKSESRRGLLACFLKCK